MKKPPLGQHFLVDEQIIQRIIESVSPDENDTMVEIGPGHGALTQRLVGKVRELHAIEIDTRLVSELQSRYSESQAVIHCSDALEFNYSALPKTNGKIRLIGNLPYSISTELISRLVNTCEIVQDICFMVQKEVAKRCTARCGTAQYGRLTVTVSRRMHCETLFDVGPWAFSPPPQVESSVVYMKPKQLAGSCPRLADSFDELVRLAFGQRRKTLRNSLSGKVTDDIFERALIDPGLRAENLTVDQFEQLANQIKCEL